jgi:hypothetical protein
LWRQHIQDYLIAAIQNIRILLTRTVLRPAASEVINLKEWMRDTERIAREPTRLGTGSLTLGQLCRKPFGLFSLN